MTLHAKYTDYRIQNDPCDADHPFPPFPQYWVPNHSRPFSLKLELFPTVPRDWTHFKIHSRGIPATMSLSNWIFSVLCEKGCTEVQELLTSLQLVTLNKAQTERPVHHNNVSQNYQLLATDHDLWKVLTKSEEERRMLRAARSRWIKRLLSKYAMPDAICRARSHSVVTR